MKKYLYVAFLIMLLISVPFSLSKCTGEKNRSSKSLSLLALTPPMGWNSFDAFDCRINESQFKRIVDYMTENLLSFGWNYAVIDYIWWHPDPGSWNNPGKRYGHPNIRYAPDGNPLDPTTIDKYGRLLPAVERFPSAAGGKGFKPLADYVHNKGMKFGIHIMRGIHRHAYYYDLPIKGTDLTARDIAEPLDTCNWCNHMLGVSPEFKGSQEYYNSLFELYASWEIDFVKVDDIMYPEYHKGEIEMIRKAIDKCGRPMVLSLSPGEAPVKMAEHLMKNANMWRISADFWDDWEKLEHSFDLLNTWSAYVSPGSWPDADMLPIGRISLDDRPHGPERWSKFTLAEQYTLLSLWIISRSPLMLGSDLVSLPDTILSLITNPEVIAVNQNSTGNKQVYNKDGTAAWTGLDPESGDKYLALFNLTDSARTVDFDFLSDSLSGKYLIRDLWKHQNKGIFYIKFGELLEPHGAGLYKLSRQ